ILALTRLIILHHRSPLTPTPTLFPYTTLFRSLAACLQVSAATTSAQSISLSGRNMSLPKVFNKIRKQTGYNFIYANENLFGASKVTIHAKNASLRQVLDRCFAHQPLTYTIDRQMIIVKRKQEPDKDVEVMTKTLAPIDVSGTVTDSATGEPLSGVTVRSEERRVGNAGGGRWP